MIDTSHSAFIGGAGIWTPNSTLVGSFSKTLTQLIKALFANSEQGVAYDPNDLTTLYQDPAGTTPVTAAGQPVGLMLDKGKGLALGLELSSYSAGFSSLAGISPVGATLSLEGTALVITAQTGAARRAEIPISGLTVGKFYKIKFIARKNEIGNSQNFQQFTSFNELFYLVNVLSTSATEYTFILKATAVSGVLRAYATSAESIGAQMIVESVSVKEIAGNHAYQTVSASRPLLQRNATTGAYYLAFDGVDDFLQTNNIDFTATDKVSLFAGARKSQDGAYGSIFEHGTDTDSNGSFALMAASGSGYYVQCGGIGSRTLVVASGGNVSPRSDSIAVKMDRSKADISELQYSVNSSVLTSDSVEIEGGGATGNFGNFPLYIGRRAGTSLPFNGHLYGLIGIGRLTTDSETIALEKSIAKNTGVTLSV